jgi:hypothetical protein
MLPNIFPAIASVFASVDPVNPHAEIAFVAALLSLFPVCGNRLGVPACWPPAAAVLSRNSGAL